MPLETETARRPTLLESIFGRKGFCCDVHGDVYGVRLREQADGGVMFKYKGRLRYGYPSGDVLNERFMQWWYK